MQAGICSGAAIFWDGGGDGVNWEDPLNWDAGAVPGAADEAFVVSGSGVSLGSDQTNVTVFLGAHQRTEHTGGRLTTGELHVGSGGGATETYAMSGTARVVTGAAFFAAGVGDAALTMHGASQLDSTGDVRFGGDGGFAGSLHEDSVLSATDQLFLDTFQGAALSLNDRSTLSVGSLFMNTFTDDPPVPAMISFIGSSITASSGDATINGKSVLSFTADAGGVSTLMVDGFLDLTKAGTSVEPILDVDLSAYSGSDPLTLIDGTETATGQFRDLPEGAILAGTGRRITYTGGDGFDVVLVAVPEPSSGLLIGLGLLCGLGLHRRR